MSVRLPRPALPLLVLYLTRDRKIVGRTRFQKLLFLIEHEVPEVKNYFEESYEWEPYHYGPFSNKLFDDLAFLSYWDFIEVVNEDEYEDEELSEETIPVIYNLTEKGAKIVEKKILPALPKDLVDKLRKIVNKYNDMPLEDLIRYVYEKYPGYTVKSRIRETILGSKNGK